MTSVSARITPGWPYRSWHEQQHRFGSNTTEALIRWVSQWGRVLDANYPHGTGTQRGRLWWQLVDARNAARLELTRRGYV